MSRQYDEMKDERNEVPRTKAPRSETNGRGKRETANISYYLASSH